MASKKITKMWVDPDFKKAIKVNASAKNMTILDYTRELAKGEEFKKDEKKSKLEFFF